MRVGIVLGLTLLVVAAIALVAGGRHTEREQQEQYYENCLATVPDGLVVSPEDFCALWSPQPQGGRAE
jgi:hypothetical protein